MNFQEVLTMRLDLQFGVLDGFVLLLALLFSGVRILRE